MNATENVIQGKYGYHPCAIDVYHKLKAIHRVYWESVYRLAAYHRWNRKEPASGYVSSRRSRFPSRRSRRS